MLTYKLQSFKEQMYMHVYLIDIITNKNINYMFRKKLDIFVTNVVACRYTYVISRLN